MVNKTKKLLRISALRLRAPWSRTASTLPAVCSTLLELLASCFVLRELQRFALREMHPMGVPPFYLSVSVVKNIVVADF